MAVKTILSTAAWMNHGRPQMSQERASLLSSHIVTIRKQPAKRACSNDSLDYLSVQLVGGLRRRGQDWSSRQEYGTH